MLGAGQPQTTVPWLHGKTLPWMTQFAAARTEAAPDRDASSRSRWGRGDSADLPEQA